MEQPLRASKRVTCVTVGALRPDGGVLRARRYILRKRLCLIEKFPHPRYVLYFELTFNGYENRTKMHFEEIIGRHRGHFNPSFKRHINPSMRTLRARMYANTFYPRKQKAKGSIGNTPLGESKARRIIRRIGVSAAFPRALLRAEHSDADQRDA